MLNQSVSKGGLNVSSNPIIKIDDMEDIQDETFEKTSQLRSKAKSFMAVSGDARANNIFSDIKSERSISKAKSSKNLNYGPDFLEPRGAVSHEKKKKRFKTTTKTRRRKSKSFATADDTEKSANESRILRALSDLNGI